MTKDARPGLPDPGFVEIDSFHAGNFLAPLTALRDQKEAYLASTWRSSFLQNIGTYESYVGNYGKAHQYFVQFENDSGIIDHPTLPTSDFAAVDAVPEIIATATANQVVFINEAHHLPAHRALTTRLLQSFWNNGFRYFAAETLDENDLNAAHP